MAHVANNLNDENNIDTKQAVPTFSATLAPGIQESIGRTLVAHYNDIAKAPIPDRFLALLAELEAKENSNEL